MGYSVPNIPGPATAPLCKACGYFRREIEANCAHEINVFVNIIDVVDGGVIYRNSLADIRGPGRACGLEGKLYISRQDMQRKFDEVARVRTSSKKPAIEDL